MWDHVREGAVNCKSRVVEFVSVLPLSEEVNWGVLVPERFPIRLMEATPGFVAVRAYSMEAGTIFAVVKRRVHVDLGRGTG